jgi:hypothetical protein
MSDSQEAGAATHVAGGTQEGAEGKIAEGEGTSVLTSKVEGEGTKPEAAAEIDYTFETPEGVTLDETSTNEFKSIAKDLKLPKDAAQKFVDLAVKREQARTEAFVKQVKDWGEQVKADKELGTTENLAAARKTIDTFGTPELKGLLESSGMGNHPEVIRFVQRIGKAISEDTFVAGRNGGGAAPRDAADVLYGKQP